MKHNIRINGQIQTLDCELGTGIYDKNGREIFEGDIVKTHAIDGRLTRRVGFNKGRFYLEDWQMMSLDNYWSENLEVDD